MLPWPAGPQVSEEEKQAFNATVSTASGGVLLGGKARPRCWCSADCEAALILAELVCFVPVCSCIQQWRSLPSHPALSGAHLPPVISAHSARVAFTFRPLSPAQHEIHQCNERPRQRQPDHWQPEQEQGVHAAADRFYPHAIL